MMGVAVYSLRPGRSISSHTTLLHAESRAQRRAATREHPNLRCNSLVSADCANRVDKTRGLGWFRSKGRTQPLKKHAAVIVTVVALLVPAQLGNPAVAAAEPAPTTPTAANTPTRYTMPSVTGITLTKATEAIAALSPSTKFKLAPVVRGGEPTQILSPGSWRVCRQTPSAGRTFTVRNTITLQVERPWNPC